MRDQLDQKVIKSRDIHFLPEYEIGVISQTTTPYEFRLIDENYPIKEIYAAASLSGRQMAKVAQEQVNLLRSENKIIRYWALIGLRSHDLRMLAPHRSEILAMTEDAYPPNSILAATISYQFFRDQGSQEILKSYCQDKNMELALMAINQLLYIDNKSPFIKVVQAVYQMENRNYKVKAACLDFLGILKLVPNDFEHKD